MKTYGFLLEEVESPEKLRILIVLSLTIIYYSFSLVVSLVGMMKFSLDAWRVVFWALIIIELSSLPFMAWFWQDVFIELLWQIVVFMACSMDLFLRRKRFDTLLFRKRNPDISNYYRFQPQGSKETKWINVRQ